MKNKLLLSFLIIASLHSYGRSVATTQITNDGKEMTKHQSLQGSAFLAAMQARSVTGKFISGETFMSPIGKSDSGRRLGHSGGGGSGGKGGGSSLGGGGGSSSVREPHGKRNSSPSILPPLYFILGLFFPSILLPLEFA